MNDGTPGNSGGSALSVIAAPAQCILVSENVDSLNSSLGQPFTYDFVSGVDYFHFQGHLGTTNFLFADGHVKSMRPVLTTQGVNMWNNDSSVAAPAGLIAKMGTETTRLAQ